MAWQMDGEQWKQWHTLFSWASKSLQMVTAVMKLKDAWSLEEKLWQASVQISSVAQSCLTPCDPMDCSTPGLPVHCQLPEFTQTHVDWVGEATQPSHPLSTPPPALSLPQHQGLFQGVSSWHQLQLQHQSCPCLANDRITWKVQMWRTHWYIKVDFFGEKESNLRSFSRNMALVLIISGVQIILVGTFRCSVIGIVLPPLGTRVYP